MVKKYHIAAPRKPKDLAGTIQLALMEMTGIGPRFYEPTGYPHDSIEDALAQDWIAIGGDMRQAANKIAAEAGVMLDGAQKKKKAKSLRCDAKQTTSATRTRRNQTRAS